MNRFQLSRNKARKCFGNKDTVLSICTIISVILAIIIYLPIRIYCPNIDVKTIYCISLPGIIFMNLLKMMILPLLILSLISGLTSLNLATGRKQGLYAILYFVLTTFLAVCQGLALACIIKPGKNMSYTIPSQDYDEVDPISSISGLLNNIFPDNIFRSTFQKFQHQFENRTGNITLNSCQKTLKIRSIVSYSNEPNYLGLIFISIFFGVSLNYLGSRGQILVTIITVLNDLTMKMVKVILWYMPIGIFFLVLSNLLEINIQESISIMWRFILTVLLGLSLHTFLVLPIIYFVLVNKNPFKLVRKLSRAILVAFVTQSSSATIPVTMSCCEDNLKIDKRVTKFMVPIGAIVNMDGTGLFESVSAIFIAQMNNVDITANMVIMIIFTSTIAAIGAATLPSGGIVTLKIVLASTGLNMRYIALLYQWDWFLDRCRTAVNILGDAFGCGIIQRLCKEELENDININDHFTTNF